MTEEERKKAAHTADRNRKIEEEIVQLSKPGVVEMMVNSITETVRDARAEELSPELRELLRTHEQKINRTRELQSQIDALRPDERAVLSLIATDLAEAMECLNKITDLPDEEVIWRAELERYHHRAELELGHLRE